MKHLSWLFLLVTAACSTVPPTNVHQPMTMRPTPRPEAFNANGAIYQAVSARPLFEDRRARYVGDTITVKITESTTASTKSNNKVDKSNTQKASIGASTGLFSRVMPGAAELSAGSSTAFSGKGEAANNNIFTGNMTVTVIDVLPNGNLLVSGEKQIAINQGNEFIRFSGIVNPVSVTGANTVQSTQVADARIEYRANGYIDETQQMGWLQRFFVNVLPF